MNISSAMPSSAVVAMDLGSVIRTCESHGASPASAPSA